MKKRSEKIEKLLGIAKAEEQQSGVAAGRAQRNLDDQVARLEELNAYRVGYAEQRRAPQRLSSVQWQDYQQFVAKMEQAIRSQQHVVADSEQTLEAHRRQWTAKRRRLESLTRVVDSYRAQERVDSDRREQREADDSFRRHSIFTEPDEND